MRVAASLQKVLAQGGAEAWGEAMPGLCSESGKDRIPAGDDAQSL